MARYYVQAHELEALPYGIFSAIDFREDTDNRWVNGIVYDAVSPQALSTDITEALTTPDTVRGEADLITVYGVARGTPGVGKPLGEFEDTALTRLYAGEERAVEGEFWETQLASNTEAEVLGSGLGIAKAVAVLEQYIGETYGSMGVIHMTRYAASLLKGTSSQGGQLRTHLGTPIVAGSGYPMGETDYASNIYATPSMFGYRGLPEVLDKSTGSIIDPGKNDAVAVAYRDYVIGFNNFGVATVETTGDN